jgi:hypothetical protein
MSPTKWYMDRSHKLLYGPKRSWGPYTILWVTDRSINCHLARSAENYLLYYTPYLQICKMTCFCYCISKTKNEFGQNPEENIILIGPGQYTKILTGQYYTIIVFCWGDYEFLWTLKSIFTEAFRLRLILIYKVHKGEYRF